jgi:ADP-ribosylglycohydrolase
MLSSPVAIVPNPFTHSSPATLLIYDAALTHPHPICQDANAVFVVAISHAVATGSDPWEIYAFTLDWATCQSTTDPAIQQCLKTAADHPPAGYLHHQGWVLIALQNAFWQLLHAPSFEAGVVDTVMRGGDTDTNAAIAGALLGAVHGIETVPPQWRDALSSCRPERGRPAVHRPRPKPFWPVDAPQLAEALVALGQSHTGSTATG